ncbi:hypothetical protein V4D00_18235, partial [Ralstonia solanacearum]|uniref:hypothetical protein n=1 Tax=Ralstonia solanacearum TaxID=305 RepID=UPI002F9556E7
TVFYTWVNIRCKNLPRVGQDSVQINKQFFESGHVLRNSGIRPSWPQGRHYAAPVRYIGFFSTFHNAGNTRRMPVDSIQIETSHGDNE